MNGVREVHEARGVEIEARLTSIIYDKDDI
jgi:hypothetical protein